jgi:predicted RNA-binding Zn-ribbon protein involved in translation (DUF1610 family)
MGIFGRLFGKTADTRDSIPPERSAAAGLRLDPDAQPPTPVNFYSRLARNTSEALGVLRGAIADGHVSNEEISFLGAWLITNREFAETWPFNELCAKVSEILQRGRVLESDRSSLYSLIERITGEQERVEQFENTPTTLPITDPAPAIVFEDREFVLTGKFECGPRKQVEAEIKLRGGRCADSVTLRTHYLVIGSLSSRDWRNTAWGNKIEKAAEYASRGNISLVTESHWRKAADRCAPIEVISKLTIQVNKIAFPCPICAHSISKSRAWLKSHDEITCPDCGNNFALQVRG